MNVSSRETSRSGRIVCPVCGSGELRFRGPTLLRFRSPALVECDSCGHNVDEAVLRVSDDEQPEQDARGWAERTNIYEDLARDERGGEEALA